MNGIKNGFEVHKSDSLVSVNICKGCAKKERLGASTHVFFSVCEITVTEPYIYLDEIYVIRPVFYEKSAPGNFDLHCGRCFRRLCSPQDSFPIFGKLVTNYLI